MPIRVLTLTSVSSPRAVASSKSASGRILPGSVKRMTVEPPKRKYPFSWPLVTGPGSYVWTMLPTVRAPTSICNIRPQPVSESMLTVRLFLKLGAPAANAIGCTECSRRPMRVGSDATPSAGK